MIELRSLIQDGLVHIVDGAMGTLLYERGVFVNVCYDELNLSHPELVEGIHREYVEAGAELLETNTFGANPVKLSGFGLDDRTREINRAAAKLARNAAAGRAAVVGAIGPLGIRIEPWGPTSEEEARGYFGRQVEGLLDGGVDGFVLETFSDLNELRQAFEAVRAVSELPVFAQVTIEEGGHTSHGTEVESVARTLDEWGVDVLGLNCSVGPAEILDAIDRMAAVTDRPLIAQPNAGLPHPVGDRKMYLASAAYMARYACRMVEAGARFVGGCCGTTPEHIRAIRLAVSEMDGKERGVVSFRRPTGRAGDSGSPSPSLDTVAPEPLADRSRLGAKLAAGEFVTTLELLSPQGWDPQPLLDDARRAARSGVDAVTVVETGRGLRRMGALPAGILLAREADVEVIVHYPCRDRSMHQMISDLLGAAASGLRNVLVVSGDLTRTGPYPDPTAVFDIDAIGLTNVLRHLNHGEDPGGQVVDPPTRFVVGVALNHEAEDADRERRRFRWKIEAGADFAVTQPVFEPAALEGFLAAVGEPRIPVLAGLWPLTSLRDAEFLDQEIPGVRVPATVLERMAAAESRGAEAAREEGALIMREILEALVPIVAGVHVTSARVGTELGLSVAAEAARRREELRHAG